MIPPPIKTRLSDKYEVRKWVEEKIGVEYLIPLLGVYDNFDDIDFDKLPNRFVLKCNHGSGYNILVKNKLEFNITNAKKLISRYLNEDYSERAYELQYKNIKKKIIIEEYIQNINKNDLFDYKFWCFNGAVHYIQFLCGRREHNLQMIFLDKNWIPQPWTYSYPQCENLPEKPNNLDKMIKLAEVLCQGFGHVRVDFYRLDDGRVYFGEMTFSSMAGICNWNLPNADMHFGSLWHLPQNRYDFIKNKYYSPNIFIRMFEKLNYCIKKLGVCLASSSMR